MPTGIATYFIFFIVFYFTNDQLKRRNTLHYITFPVKIIILLFSRRAHVFLVRISSEIKMKKNGGRSEEKNILFTPPAGNMAVLSKP